ncbi:aminotransferase class I/II-fold pyridoxal phosphate-dependent enzyme [Acinetobacter sp. CFCC 10889]|uniref:aminotransferase class I/II-fold pyridoxal phosphate-dependent enzyme n=1 Tax=Acinetobacter sp. CFCC 10889 TaxID=1775557 RepID=UPI000DCF86B5|nr:aminotransferase class I/II-fold pyridoxal phosphate-dependent enzyme [Acinetobacter sp. CFCC 10889]
MKIQGKNGKEIQDSIRLLITQGVYQEGDTLPNIRDLAQQLNVNRNTVSTAYAALAKLGVIQTNKRLGTQVSPIKLRGGEGVQSNLQSEICDLTHGNPNQKLLPNLQNIHFKNLSVGLYGENIYHEELKEYAIHSIFSDILKRHPSACYALSNGATDGIEKILSAYLLAQDHVAIESPGYINSIKILENQNYQIHSIHVNQKGYHLKDIQQALKNNIKALIITPRAHNPTGYSLTMEDALNIKNMLREYPNTLILVDDHFSLISNEEYQHIIPENAENWAVLRSVSKFLGPDLRFCFICCDPHTANLLSRKMNAGTTWVSHLLQDIVYQLLTQHGFEQQVAKAQQHYAKNNQYFVALMQQKKLSCAVKYDGLNVWLEQDQPQQCIEYLLEKGWSVRIGRDFFVENTSFGIRMTLSNLSHSQIEALVNDLAKIIV